MAAATHSLIFLDADTDLDALLGMDDDAPEYDLNETAFAALSIAGFLTAGRSAAAHNLARAGFLTRVDHWSPWTRTPAGDALLAAQD